MNRLMATSVVKIRLPVIRAQRPLIDCLISEVNYLRSQLDKQTQLLAALTAQNSNMMAKLKPAPRPSWFERIRQKFPVNSAKNEPDTETP